MFRADQSPLTAAIYSSQHATQYQLPGIDLVARTRHSRGVHTPALKDYRRGPADGERLGILGGLYTFKALGEETGGAYTLVEVQAAAGFAAPLHWHERE